MQVGRLMERFGGQVEEPGGDHAAASPHLGYRRDVDLVLVVLGVLERRRLGVVLTCDGAGVGVLEDVQALGIGGHDAVLDPVVHHLDEVAGAGGTAVQIAALGDGRPTSAAGCS